VAVETLSTGLIALLIAWGAVTVVLICALIYRSTLEVHEEDQMFLAPAGEILAREQRALVAKIESLSRPIKVLWIASATLLVVTAGLWVWQGIKNF
jgi:hypothetical protein